MRTLLVLAALAAPAAADDAALVKRVAELGGKVEREDKKPAGPITDIDLSNKAATDADLKLIAGAAPGLKYLDLSKTKVTDDGLAEVAKLKALRYLTLDETKVTNKGVQRLTGLKLVSISLMECPVDDAALESLGKIKTLERVTLWEQKGVTDAGLKHLSGLSQLSLLTLYGTGVKGPGLTHLAKLKGLKDLDLKYTAFDDAGLKLLAKLPGLQRVHVGNTKVTKAEVEKAAKALPNVTINAD